MNKYQYVRELGIGASGRVFLSQYQDQNQIQRQVAIKEISQNNQNGQQNLYFQKEINIIQELIDCYNEGRLTKNVLNCYEMFTQDSKQYIVSEYCEYGDLYQHLNQYHQLYNIEQLLYMCIQIANGVQNLHNIGITHRDLKPENILITQIDGSYFLKITDFGVSSIQNMKSTVGTVNYIAPEILSMEVYTNKIDVWSLGCLIYEMIYNKQLFTASNQVDVVRIIKEFRSYRNSDQRDIYKELNEVIRKCLSVNPEERPTSSDILISLHEINNKYFNENINQPEEKKDIDIKHSYEINIQQAQNIKENRVNSVSEQNQYGENTKPNLLEKLITEFMLNHDEQFRLDIQSLSKSDNKELLTLEQIKQFDINYNDECKSINSTNKNKIITSLLLLSSIHENQEDGYEKLSKQLSFDNVLQEDERIQLYYCLIKCITENNIQDKINQFFKFLKNSKFQNIINKLSKQNIQYQEDIKNLKKIQNLITPESMLRIIKKYLFMYLKALILWIFFYLTGYQPYNQNNTINNRKNNQLF